ncbi:unnamed protein product [Sphagnum balticum]
MLSTSAGLRERIFREMWEPEFQLFYTIFAFPNIFATFIIGFLIDFLGVRTGIIALSAGVAFFQLVIAIGGYAYSYTTILIGRMLFGLASESLITAQASMVSFWFKGKELAFALGIAVTFPELGNALNSYLTPIIYNSTDSLGTPLLVSVFICIVSLICALTAAFLDKKADTALVVTYVVAAVFSAPLGLLIDKVGYKRYFIMLSMVIFTVAQMIIWLYPQCTDIQENGAIVGLAFIGLGYCFYGNCILPAIPLVVKKKVTGTAFGIMQMIESVALSFFPLITGAIVEDATSTPIGYVHSSLFFVSVGFLGIFTSFGLFCVSDKVKKKLDKRSKEKMKV